MKQKLRPDPIVAELHKVRRKYWVEAHQNPALLWKNILKQAELAMEPRKTRHNKTALV